MTKSWYPPVLFPIPKGHYSHYQTIPTTDQLYNLLRRHRILNYEEPPKTTWFRLFKRRAGDKRVKPKRYAPYYAIYNSSRELIRVERTKKAALALLEKSAIQENTDYNTLSKYKVELDIGSHVVKAHFYDDFDYHGMHHPVAVKRCAECPNKTSKQGACACGFWSAIRDNTQSWIWWSPQEHKEYIKRQLKEIKQVIKVDTLFDKLNSKK